DNANTQQATGMRELELPFSVEGVDFQQKVIDKNRGLEFGNTLDWLTRVRIHDKETGQQTEALIHMNHPFDYRGYRFFQVNGDQTGNARTITLRVTPAADGTPQVVTLERIGPKAQAKLSDGTVIQYRQFNPAFTVNREGQVEIGSADYQNPAALLAVIYPDGDNRDVWAFTEAGRMVVEQAPF